MKQAAAVAAEPADALRARVLAVAAKALVRDGPAALTMRAVAADAGCSTMMLYTLFGGKQPLLDALYDDGFALLAGTIAAAAREPDPCARLRRQSHAYRAFALAHRTLYAAMFSRPIASARRRVSQARRETRSFALLTEAVRYACERGAIASTHSPSTVADALWSAVHGYVSLEVSGHLADGSAASAAGFEALLDLLLAGLAVRPPPASEKERR